MALANQKTLVSRLLDRLGLSRSEHAEAGGWLDSIAVEKRGELIEISCARIILIEAKGSNVSIVTAEGTWLTPGTISDLERNLDPGIFLRIHRSTIVNKKKIGRVSRLTEGRLNFHMSNDKVVGSSEVYQEAITKALPDLA